ncbi:MAG TPA: BON domain-containing protein [Blastocatellia bacterium]|nr:BON domain-containing protein [Blastocatellia bacterium]
MTKIRRRTGLVGIFLALAICAGGALAAPPSEDVNTGERVRKELVTLPYYGVFDNLSYEISGGTVTLSGQVVRPTTRSDAAHRVARIKGVERVVNNIEVLPLSRFDDSIRVRAYNSIFRTASLYRYALGANPSVHIIVNNGRITLEGVVDNESDSHLAYLAANGVSGAFSVTNNLRVKGNS